MYTALGIQRKELMHVPRRDCNDLEVILVTGVFFCLFVFKITSQVWHCSSIDVLRTNHFL